MQPARGTFPSTDGNSGARATRGPPWRLPQGSCKPPPIKEATAGNMQSGRIPARDSKQGKPANCRDQAHYLVSVGATKGQLHTIADGRSLGERPGSASSRACPRCFEHQARDSRAGLLRARKGDVRSRALAPAHASGREERTPAAHAQACDGRARRPPSQQWEAPIQRHKRSGPSVRPARGPPTRKGGVPAPRGVGSLRGAPKAKAKGAHPTRRGPTERRKGSPQGDRLGDPTGAVPFTRPTRLAEGDFLFCTRQLAAVWSGP